MNEKVKLQKILAKSKDMLSWCVYRTVQKCMMYLICLKILNMRAILAMHMLFYDKFVSQSQTIGRVTHNLPLIFHFLHRIRCSPEKMYKQIWTMIGSLRI